MLDSGEFNRTEQYWLNICSALTNPIYFWKLYKTPKLVQEEIDFEGTNIFKSWAIRLINNIFHCPWETPVLDDLYQNFKEQRKINLLNPFY